MLKQTKEYKEMMVKDIGRIYEHNNSKDEKRTDEQRLQAQNDKKNYYLKKWNELLEASTTQAQKDYCNNVLSRIDLIR